MARKPNYVKEFIPYTQLVEKMTIWRGIIASRFDYSKHLIENEYGVDADRVKDIFLMAWDMSKKDYPSPTFPKPSTPKEYQFYNKYILYLWEYYVEDNEEPDIPDEPDISEDSSSSAITLSESGGEGNTNQRMYEGFREEDLVDEEIDERILKLLGLEDTFDIDYGTYLTLLKEKMIAGRMTDSKLSSEETELLTNEYKRIRNNVGRFRIKKKPYTEGFNVNGPISIVKDSFFAAQRVQVPDQQNTENSTIPLNNIVEDIAIIRKTVENILDLMIQQRTLLLNEVKRDRRFRESQKRSKKESLLEKSGKAAFNVAKKILSPVQNILDKIISFLSTVILGRIVYKLFQWMSDPKNKKKVDAILRFLKDWGLSLLAGYLLFGTSIGKLVRTVIGTLTKLTFTMLRKGIPMLLNFAKSNPYATAALALAGVGIAANAVSGQTEAAPVQAENKAKAQTGKGIGVQGTDTMTDKTPSVGNMGATTPYGLVQGVSGGGRINSSKVLEKPIRVNSFSGGAEVTESVPVFDGGKVTNNTGQRIVGAGKDTQLTALQPGEIVISKPAVNKFGSDFFLSLNKAGGGTNIPKIANNIQFAAGGGMIGLNNAGMNIKNDFSDNFSASFDKLHTSKPYAKLYDNKKISISPDFKVPTNIIRDNMAEKKKNANTTISPNYYFNSVNPITQNESVKYTKNKNINFIDRYDQKNLSNENIFSKNIIEHSKILNRNSKNISPSFIFMDKSKVLDNITNTLNVPKEYNNLSTNIQTSNLKNVTTESNKLPSVNIATISKNIKDIPVSPSPKINLVHISNEQLKKVQMQKSVGNRSINTDFPVYYPNKTRSMLIQTYGIQGIE